MGHPMRLFYFFWPWCGRWKVVAAISSKKSGTISFFFIIFWRFLPIFPFFGFLAHFAHFMPPYGRPLITCDPISYFRVSWVQLAHGWHCRQEKSMNFGFFKKNDHFSIFGHFVAWGPPYMAKPLQRGALGNTSIGPRQFLGPNHNPEQNASWIRSPTPVLGHLKGSSMEVTKWAKISIP